MNYTVIECIFRDLGVKVIWFDDLNDLPPLIEEVFGLETNALLETEDLLNQTESKIKEIQDIEMRFKGSLDHLGLTLGFWDSFL